MFRKNLLKVVVALGVLAAVLIFLGVNFVPQIFATTPGIENSGSSLSLVGSDWIERHPSNYYLKSDWIERHPSNYYTNSDWIERHPALSTNLLYFDNSDWIQQHSPNYYQNSDWIERHPSTYYTNSDWIERHPVKPGE